MFEIDDPSAPGTADYDYDNDNDAGQVKSFYHDQPGRPRPAAGLTPETRHLKPFPKTAIVQEIIVRPDGTVEIPWLTPGATELVVALGRLLNREQGFEVGLVSGNIYCG